MATQLQALAGRVSALARPGLALPVPTSPVLSGGALRFIAHYVRKRPWHFGSLLALLVAGAASAIAVQYSVKLLVDAMAEDNGPRSAVWQPLLLFIGLIAVESVFWRTAGCLNCRTVVATGVDMRLDLFAHLSGQPMRYFANHFSGALAGRITATAQAFQTMANTAVWNIVPPCVDFIGAVIVFTTVDWRMAAALAVMVVMIAGLLVLIGLRGQTFHRVYAERASRVSGELVDTIANHWAVNAFSARRREFARLSGELGSEATAQCRSLLYLERMRILHDTALWLMAGGMLAWAVYWWSLGRITPGEVVLVSALSFRILHGSRELALALTASTQHVGLIDETLRAIGQPHAVTDRPDARHFLPLGGSIELENVAYAYPDGRQVFRHLSLRIPAGQKVGIAGPSGAGKSTLVGLVQRLDDVQRGRILIDGQPITAVTQESLRAAIAVVPQEISLFHRSITENIRYGRPDATDEEVRSAARAARCDAFIRSLPHGYDTPVGERGVKLSGGQRQRIGLARAILKNAPIIILDEATSALDTESEIEIQHALDELMRDRTVLAVAHRLSTLTDFDRIIVLMDGEIVEDGSPAELRRRGGVFDTLWRMQAEGLAIEAVEEEARAAIQD